MLIKISKIKKANQDARRCAQLFLCVGKFFPSLQFSPQTQVSQNVQFAEPWPVLLSSYTQWCPHLNLFDFYTPSVAHGSGDLYTLLDGFKASHGEASGGSQPGASRPAESIPQASDCAGDLAPGTAATSETLAVATESSAPREESVASSSQVNAKCICVIRIPGEYWSCWHDYWSCCYSR